MKPLLLILTILFVLPLSHLPAAEVQGGIDPCNFGSWEGPYPHMITVGDWPLSPMNPNNEAFNPIHAALLPKGPNRGNVLVWDNESQSPPDHCDHMTQLQWIQRYSVINTADLTNPVNFKNEEFALPLCEGDLYCAGFSWTRNGDLFVAGGNTRYLGDHGGINKGGRLTYVFFPNSIDPVFWPVGEWVQQVNANLDLKRWYPTVMLMPPAIPVPTAQYGGKDRMLVFGGNDDNGVNLNTYMSFIPSDDPNVQGLWQTNSTGGTVFNGPSSGPPMDVYPRMHMLSDGKIAKVGMRGAVDLLTHDPTHQTTVLPSWNTTPTNMTDSPRYYGSAVLDRIQHGTTSSYNKVYIFGGNAGVPQVAETDWKSVESFQFIAPYTGPWTDEPDLNEPRWYQNAVVYPDGVFYVFGGLGKPAAEMQEGIVACRYPQRLARGAPSWSSMNAASRDHGQHSIAVLLPNGKILVGGSERGLNLNDKLWDKRYELFTPPNLACATGPRPQIVDPSPILTDDYLNIHYGDTTVLPIEYSYSSTDGSVVQKVVLVRPAAVTHGWDADQRVIELQIRSHQPPSGGQNGFIEVIAPATGDVNLVIPGHYMLFLMTDTKVPCALAAWVRILY